MKKIDMTSLYYFAHVVREGWLGSTSPFTCKRLLSEHHDLLKPQYSGHGRSTRIILTGENILAFRKNRV